MKRHRDREDIARAESRRRFNGLRATGEDHPPEQAQPPTFLETTLNAREWYDERQADRRCELNRQAEDRYRYI